MLTIESGPGRFAPSAPARKNALSRHRASIRRIGLIPSHNSPSAPQRLGGWFIGIIPSHPPTRPQKARNIVRQNLRKPQQNPTS
jgi:hypothetical protein